MIVLVRRWSSLIALTLLAGCPKAGGAYEPVDREAGDVDRGETQAGCSTSSPTARKAMTGRSGSVAPRCGSRTRGEQDVEDLGTKNLDRKETQKVWDLIDRLEISERRKGKKDEEDGYVQLRLREPGGEEGHDIFQVYVSRATEDEDVLALADT